ncbi:hypothetical protein TNCV_170941 [Trichonephila clavipes]|nr:hypothetical protein TNCV_170941 [Trichonephila clavipes]
MLEKVTILLKCPAVSSEEFIAVVDHKVCTTPIMANKDILEFVQSSEGIIDTHFNDENEKNNIAPVPTSSKMRNTMKKMRSF